MKRLATALFMMLICAPLYATQTVDPRRYVDDEWRSCAQPYNQLLKMTGDGFICTAQYVAPNMILTALHCLVNKDDNLRKENFHFKRCDGQIFTAHLEQTGDLNTYKTGTSITPVDWAILRITDPKFYTTDFLDIPANVQSGKITGVSAGWGALPIVSDEDLTRIRREINQHIQNENLQKYATSDGADGPLYGLMNASWFEQLLRDDSDKIKAHQSCTLQPAKYFANEYESTCFLWGGNSGGPFFVPSEHRIYGVASTSIYTLPNQNQRGVTSYYVPLPVANQALAQLRAQHPATPTSAAPSTPSNPTPQKQTTPVAPNTGNTNTNTDATTPQAPPTPTPIPNVPSAPSTPTTPNAGDGTNTPTTPTTPSDDEAQNLIDKNQLDTMGNGIYELLKNANNLSDLELLAALGSLMQYQHLQKQYEAAKAREKSTANKILGGLTMAATGIGAMQGFQGNAEQSADAAAERDMQAYLETFRCEYGDGKNFKGGDMNIELPASHDLLPYYNEYMELATALKETKAALNMSAGIESETVFDKATTGLYDDVGIGKTGGVFTSLSRALMDPTGKDAEKWAAQKSDAKQTQQTGTTMGVAGAAGGLLGNTLINHTGNKDTNTSGGFDIKGLMQQSGNNTGGGQSSSGGIDIKNIMGKIGQGSK